MQFTKRVRAGVFGAALTTLAGLAVAGAAWADTVVSSKSEQRFTAYLTGYSYWDNTPPGSSAIARPVVHRRAGGSGTYNDPVTIAVGHSINGGRQTLDFPAGTRFYIEGLKKYAIVEDVCGDGPKPQLTGCARGKQGRPWLDIYIGGAKSNSRAANACASAITRFHNIVMNPAPNYPVIKGEVMESNCRG